MAAERRHPVGPAVGCGSRLWYVCNMADLSPGPRTSRLLSSTRIHEDIFDRSIDVQVLRLRRKLETDPSAPRIIQTERGIGYVFSLPVERL